MNQIVKFAENGLVTREKLIGEQLDPDAIDYRVRDESLIPLQRGVYRVMGVPETFELRARAACIYAGKELAISHAGAAYLHGLEGFAKPENLEALLPPYAKATPRGVVVRRTAEPFQSIELEGIRTTSLARTLIDLADGLTMDELETVLNAAWREQSTIYPWLRQEIERAGLPKPTKGLVILDDQGHYVIRGDLGWARWKTVLHVDSVAWHGTEKAMVRDAQQRSELSLLKWTQITVMKRTLKEGLWLAQLDRALRPR